MSLFQVSIGVYFLSAKSVAYLIISKASQLVELKNNTHTHLVTLVTAKLWRV